MVKQPRREADQYPLFWAEVKNEWRYNSTPLQAFTNTRTPLHFNAVSNVSVIMCEIIGDSGDQLIDNKVP